MRFGLRKIFSLFFFGMFAVVLFSSLSVNAQSGYELLAPIPTVVDDAGNPITTNITLVDYMKGLFVAAIGLAIVLAVVQLVIGGIEYVAAAVPSAKEDAKRRIGGAVGGLLLILLSWVLLQALNPKLLSVGLNLEKIAVVGQPPGSGGGPPPPPPTWCMFNNQSNLKLTGEFDTEVLCNDAKGSLDVTCRLCTWTPGGGNKDWVTFFSFDPGIKKQVGDASGPLSTLLSCMAGKLTPGVGVISSISDSSIANGSKTFTQCAQSGCAHTAHSCHYGGRSCIGSSFAVDFGDQQNKAALRAAATSCNGGAWVNDEGNHLHISVGNISGCNCDV